MSAMESLVGVVLGATPVVVEARDVAQVEVTVTRAAELHGRFDGLASCFGTLRSRA